VDNFFSNSNIRAVKMSSLGGGDVGGGDVGGGDVGGGDVGGGDVDAYGFRSFVLVILLSYNSDFIEGRLLHFSPVQ
jgi:hypothetical protein